MPSLCDVQAAVRAAVLGAGGETIRPHLMGGGDPSRRLALHARHYATSVTAAIEQKFPACGWLIGAGALANAARAFARQQPPDRPCIAEYGSTFPAFLARRLGSALPYLDSFATLEWHVGQAAIAVERPAIHWADIMRIDLEVLAGAKLSLQPGTAYVRAAWAIDELLALYLREAAPDQYVLSPEEVWLEVTGARGAFRMTRLAAGDFVFRRALHDGASIGAAAADALDADASFDAGRALASVVGAGLVTAARVPGDGER